MYSSFFNFQIILLTDGQVFNVDQVKELVSSHAHETRVFAVGIGHGASTALVNGLARAGNGRSEMVYQQDKLQMKVCDGRNLFKGKSIFLYCNAQKWRNIVS